MQENTEQTTIENEREAQTEYEYKMIEAFTRKPEKVEWYKRAFDKYNINGVDVVRWNWSWWAFLGGFWFLLYRKAYLAAAILFIIVHVVAYMPIAGLIVWIASGGLSMYFVYKVYKRKKFQIEAAQMDDELRAATMRHVGGYHQWVVYAAIVYFLLIILGAVSQVAPELLPM